MHHHGRGSPNAYRKLDPFFVSDGWDARIGHTDRLILNPGPHPKPPVNAPASTGPAAVHRWSGVLDVGPALSRGWSEESGLFSRSVRI